MPKRVQSGDGPDEFGPWEEIIASTPHDAAGYWVTLWIDLGAAVTVEAGIGAKGHELARDENTYERRKDGDPDCAQFLVSHEAIPAGSRMVARIRSPRLNQIGTVEITLVQAVD